MQVVETGLLVGGAVSLSSMAEMMRTEVARRPEWQTRSFAAVLDQLRSVLISLRIIYLA